MHIYLEWMNWDLSCSITWFQRTGRFSLQSRPGLHLHTFFSLIHSCFLTDRGEDTTGVPPRSSRYSNNTWRICRSIPQSVNVNICSATDEWMIWSILFCNFLQQFSMCCGSIVRPSSCTIQILWSRTEGKQDLTLSMTFSFSPKTNFLSVICSSDQIENVPTPVWFGAKINNCTASACMCVQSAKPQICRNSPNSFIIHN